MRAECGKLMDENFHREGCYENRYELARDYHRNDLSRLGWRGCRNDNFESQENQGQNYFGGKGYKKRRVVHTRARPCGDQASGGYALPGASCGDHAPLEPCALQERFALHSVIAEQKEPLSHGN